MCSGVLCPLEIEDTTAARVCSLISARFISSSTLGGVASTVGEMSTPESILHMSKPFTMSVMEFQLTLFPHEQFDWS